MLLRRVDVLVPEHISYKVNIAGFLIKCRAIGASQLVRCDFFGRRDLAGVLFYHIFHSLYTNPFPLSRVEESMLMSGHRCDRSAVFQIIEQRLLDLIAEINHHFRSALAHDPDCIIFKINILHIQSDTF